MKDWNNLIADVDKILPSGLHNTAGREGHKIDFVGIHHNAGNSTIDSCYNNWLTREASAHYQVEASGRIGQLVNDKDTAWALANWSANLRSINIEHANNSGAPNWTIFDATLDNGAHLVAAVCRYYGLGKPVWMKNVFPHSYFTITTCPGALAGSQNNAYMQRAQMYYDQMIGGISPEPTPTSSPSKPILPANYPWPWPLIGAHFFGDIDGPMTSHGGYYKAEQKWVKAIQQALILAGFVPGITDANSSWADGLFEKETVEAVIRFQRAQRPNSTSRWGEFWSDDAETLKYNFT